MDNKIKSCYLCKNFILSNLLNGNGKSFCEFFPKEMDAKLILNGYYCQKFDRVDIIVLTATRK